MTDLNSMNKKISIASVTAVYNGARVLPRQLEALRGLTRRLDEIIVVNNASTDDTVSAIKEHGSEVTILNLPENGGVGGGFAAGLQYAAYEKKHDWIWLLDDDSVPAPDTLERLIGGLDFLGENAASTAILAPVCANSESQVGYSASLWRDGHRHSKGAKNQRIFFVDSVISSGTLLRREAVEEIGLPREDYFMDFVDHEYCLRLRRHGYKIAVVADSRLEHALGEPTTTNVFGFTRNWTLHAPWREYYMARNEIFTVWKYFPDWRARLITGRRLLRHALGVILFGQKKLACLAMMYRGIADGRAGRLGIRHFEH
jgi:GT2 family glycosyltransferase